ncbi:MAG: hypothetical protein JWO31_2787 [Phycisphaerales bacterium]|nr:hypothetical protein [Phycisphaerales bacterium]
MARPTILRVLLLIPAAWAAWLLFEAAHEAGHVLHAAASGGRVVRVELPLLGFSRTDVSPNPCPAIVAWGGPAWGSVLPVVAWAAVPSRWPAARRAARAFAGFCLVANGSYLAAGCAGHVGDAGDLLRHGTPAWLVVAAGSAAAAAGLWVWHGLGGRPAGRQAARE